MKVSVVVPVWNPGPSLQRCLDSLMNQTLAADQYEVVFVDDGSTDGTAQRLDELAAEYPGRVQVLHIANTGWPGTPRNVGIAASRGEYVQFVDNDDVLAAHALEALHNLAAGSDADVVIGKLSSDFRGVNHAVFRHSVSGKTLANFPLVETLTPHKMFRKAFLDEHNIRYPDGPTHLEDQLFVMKAYVHSTSVAILADEACYFYLRRLGSGRNAGDIAMVPAEYYRALEQVLDVVEAGVPSGALRNLLHRRFYRVELLGRLSGRAMRDYTDGYRRDLASCVGAVVANRFDPDVHAGSGAAIRTQGRLLLDDDLPGLVRLAEQYGRITLRATASRLRWERGSLCFDVEAALHWGEEPMRCERSNAGWVLPAPLAPAVPERDRLLDDVRDQPDFELSVVSRLNSASFGRVAGLYLHIENDGVVRLSGAVAVDPSTAMGGHSLSAGIWDLRLRLRFAGWSRAASLRPSAKTPTLPLTHVCRDTRIVTSYWTRPNPAIALDVDQWAHSLTTQAVSASTLAPDGRNALVYTLRVTTEGDVALPPAELLLEPTDGTPGRLLVCPARLVARGGRAVATVRPRWPTQDGDWHVWLRIGAPGSTPPMPLPFTVRRRGRKTVLDPPASPAREIG